MAAGVDLRHIGLAAFGTPSIRSVGSGVFNARACNTNIIGCVLSQLSSMLALASTILIASEVVLKNIQDLHDT